MVDNTGRAVLAGFSQLTFILDQSSSLSSRAPDSSVPLMTPELLTPERFGPLRRQPMRESDCYLLGMVIYGILSGSVPFGTSNPLAIFCKVRDAEHPERPQGDAGKLFTDGLWSVLERCWKTEPNERASAKDVLWYLEGNLPVVNGGDGKSGTKSQHYELDRIASSSGKFSSYYSRSL
jgi:hypothetical protein